MNRILASISGSQLFLAVLLFAFIFHFPLSADPLYASMHGDFRKFANVSFFSCTNLKSFLLYLFIIVMQTFEIVDEHGFHCLIITQIIVGLCIYD